MASDDPIKQKRFRFEHRLRNDSSQINAQLNGQHTKKPAAKMRLYRSCLLQAHKAENSLKASNPEKHLKLFGEWSEGSERGSWRRTSTGALSCCCVRLGCTQLWPVQSFCASYLNKYKCCFRRRQLVRHHCFKSWSTHHVRQTCT